MHGLNGLAVLALAACAAALCRVTAGTTMAEVVKRLLRPAAGAGVKPRHLLLDRQSYRAGAIRDLQAARSPSVMPAAINGRKPQDPARLRGLWALAQRRCGGWSSQFAPTR